MMTRVLPAVHGPDGRVAAPRRGDDDQLIHPLIPRVLAVAAPRRGDDDPAAAQPRVGEVVLLPLVGAMMTAWRCPACGAMVGLLPLVGAMMTAAARRAGRAHRPVAAPRRGDDDLGGSPRRPPRGWRCCPS